jgi:hypothetical protein
MTGAKLPILEGSYAWTVQERQSFVHQAELRLRLGTDTAAPGGAVTSELCGSSDHTPPCRWPHNNQLVDDKERSLFRTVFVSSLEDEHEIRLRIERALYSSPDWEVVSLTRRDLTSSERILGARLNGINE